jgi:hypothetical protein
MKKSLKIKTLFIILFVLNILCSFNGISTRAIIVCCTANIFFGIALMDEKQTKLHGYVVIIGSVCWLIGLGINYFMKLCPC